MQHTLLCTLIIAVLAVHAELTIYSPAEIAGNYQSYGYKFYGKAPPYVLDGTMVVADPLDACKPLINVDRVNGSIVIAKDATCSSATKARHVQQAGGIAIVITNPIRYWLNCYDNDKDGHDIHIAILDATNHESTDDLNPLINYISDHRDLVANVTVVPEKHFWDNNGLWIPWDVIYQIWCLFNMGLASWKFYRFTLINKAVWKPSMAQSTLFLQFGTNLIRFVFFIDQKARGLLTYASSVWLETVSFPYCLVASLIIAFYWQEMILRMKEEGLTRKIITLKRMRIPFAVATVVVILIDHISTGLRSSRLGGTSDLVYLGSIIIAISTLGCALFFLITGIRIMRMIYHSTTNTEITVKMTALIIVGGIGLLVAVICVVIPVVISSDALSDASYTTMYLLTYGAYAVASTAQIFLFTTPEAPRTDTPSTHSHSKGSRNSVEMQKTELLQNTSTSSVSV